MKNRKIIRKLFLLFSTYFMIVASGCSESQTQTAIENPLPDSAFKANITIKNPPTSLKINSLSKIEVKVKNTSSTVWPHKGKSDGKFSIKLAYHWLDKSGKVVSEGNRTYLPYDLAPNKTVNLQAEVQSPANPGEYILKVDLVQEAVSWFEDKGVKPVAVKVNVQ